MTGKDILIGMSHINAAYVREAENEQKRRPAAKSWKQWGAIAACFALILTALLSGLPNLLQGTTPPVPSGGPYPGGAIDAPYGGEIDEGKDVPNGMEEQATVLISLSNVFINEVAEMSADAALKLDPEIHETAEWDTEEVIGYLGRDFTPQYVPENLEPAEWNGTTRIIRNKDGTMIRDIVGFNFYTGYDEYGLAEIDETFAGTGFSLSVSKMGSIVRCCLYLLPDDEIKTTDIAGVPVTIGYRAMPYGPYDPETNEPAGTYDLYVVEFEVDGVTCEIIAEKMELEEIVKVAASVICETDNIVIED